MKPKQTLKICKPELKFLAYFQKLYIKTILL